MKIVRSDNGPEFTIPKFYASKCILHQTSSVETPQQNARVERKHQHILNIIKAFLFQSHLPKSFWSYAAVHTVFIMNRVPSPVLQNQSPYFLMHKTQPDLHQLKVFGSLAYASTLQAHRSKLASRARKCIFLGYKSGMKGVVHLDMHSKQIFVSWNVTHHECILSYQSNPSSISWNYHTNIIQESTSEIVSDISPLPTPENVFDILPIYDGSPHHTTNSTSPSSTTSPILTKSTRSRAQPAYLKDYVCNSSTQSPASVNSGISYPIASFHSFHHLSPTHKALSTFVTQSTEPKTYKEACKSDHWLRVMNIELEAPANNGTWCIVDTPPNVKPIGCKWVYRIKYKADGSLERYKARLVAKGYNQIEGLDFFDTFSLVAKLTTVRNLLAIASIHNWHMHQLDVNNAFLHGDLQEIVYMAIPEGIISSPEKVCKLKISLYGLKQASRKWYEKLTTLLLPEGNCQSTADYSLFTLQHGSDFTALLVYVDDIILAGTSLI